MDPTSVTPNISLYVDWEINRTFSLRSLQEPILEKAVEHSGGRFLWARMMLNYLKKSRAQNTVLRCLQELPTGLARVYDHLSSEVTDSLHQELSQNQTLFLLLICVFRPLSPEKISVLIALHYPLGLLDGKDFLNPKARF